MLFDDDDTPGEPDLPDPGRDAETKIDIPSVDTPEAEVPGDLLRTFWVLVALSNVAVLAVSLGLMLIGFRGQLELGGGLVVLGLLFAADVVLRYRRYRDADA